MGKRKELWIQQATTPHTKGALHRQLGIPTWQKIPTYKLERIIATDIGKTAHIDGQIKVTPLLKQRAIFALNVRKSKH